MKTRRILILLCAVFFFMAACDDDNPVVDCSNVNELQLNQYQVLGSHNSYRLNTPIPLVLFLQNADDLLPPGFDPGTWDYTHEPLLDQLNLYRMRSVELDVFRDPQGGMFYNRMGNGYVNLPIESGEAKLLEPGLKILHFPDFDYVTQYLTFKDALNAIRNWSLDHPNHLPLSILVEAKEDNPDAMLPGFGLTSILPFDNGSVEEIDNEIKEVFATNLNHIFVPDDLKGSYGNLREAAMDHAWPTLGELRGKIFFIMNATEAIIDDYIDGHPSLSDRIMFVFRQEEQNYNNPESVFLMIDDPVGEFDLIQQYVHDGYMVRTRSDADTYEARTGDTYRMETAFLSGAQIISTDYYRADPRHMMNPEWTSFQVRFPNGKLALMNDMAPTDMETSCSIKE